MTESSTPPGVPSPARLAAWLNDHVPGGPLELTDIQLIAGGRSNLTYRLTVSGPGAAPGTEAGPGAAPGTEAAPGSAADGTRLLVLRRPPLGHVLPTAHDMSREFRVLSALAGTRVPVAPLVASCTDDEVIGAPFYVMEYVPGVVLRTRADTKALTEAQAAELSRRLAEMLAAIHDVDVNQVGLGDLGRGAGYLRRQLDRWQRQWELSATQDRPGYTQLVQRLTAALPAEGQTTLVHGDYRLDNALVTLNPQPRITAVVDWEMATLGDPLADLGLTLVYWTEDGEEGWLTPAGATGRDARGDGRRHRQPRVLDPGRVRRRVRPAHRAGRVPDRLLRGVRLLQAGRRPGGHPRPVPAGQNGRRRLRARRLRRTVAHRSCAPGARHAVEHLIRPGAPLAPASCPVPRSRRVCRPAPARLPSIFEARRPAFAGPLNR